MTVDYKRLREASADKVIELEKAVFADIERDARERQARMEEKKQKRRRKKKDADG